MLCKFQGLSTISSGEKKNTKAKLIGFAKFPSRVGN